MCRVQRQLSAAGGDVIHLVRDHFCRETNIEWLLTVHEYHTQQAKSFSFSKGVNGAGILKMLQLHRTASSILKEEVIVFVR